MNLLIASIFFLSAQANALVLMKCNSLNIGTLWSSYGRQWRSGQDTPRIFPTEIVFFGADGSMARKVYEKIDQALQQVQVVDDLPRMRLVFSLQNGAVTQSHLIQLLQFDMRDPNSLMGNWTVSEPGKKDVVDQIACTQY